VGHTGRLVRLLLTAALLIALTAAGVATDSANALTHLETLTFPAGGGAYSDPTETSFGPDEYYLFDVSGTAHYVNSPGNELDYDAFYVFACQEVANDRLFDCPESLPSPLDAGLDANGTALQDALNGGVYPPPSDTHSYSLVTKGLSGTIVFGQPYSEGTTGDWTIDISLAEGAPHKVLFRFEQDGIPKNKTLPVSSSGSGTVTLPAKPRSNRLTGGSVEGTMTHRIELVLGDVEEISISFYKAQYVSMKHRGRLVVLFGVVRASNAPTCPVASPVTILAIEARDPGDSKLIYEGDEDGDCANGLDETHRRSRNDDVTISVDRPVPV
jgi:hypothetical protein